MTENVISARKKLRVRTHPKNPRRFIASPAT